MLSRFGTKQPPQKYPNSPASASTLCGHCTSKLFGQKLFDQLLSAQGAGNGSFEFSYNRRGHEIRQACIEGCKWCQSVANAVHSALHLDRVYELWNQSQSDGIDEDDIEAVTGDELAEDSNEDDSPEGEDHTDGVFGTTDTTRTEVLDEEVDVLDNSSELQIYLCFKQEIEMVVFTSLEVRIKCTGEDTDTSVGQLQDENAVILEFKLHGSGTLSESILPTLEPEVRLDSESSFSSAQTFVWNCQNQGCSVAKGGDFLPSRLISVKDHGSPHVIASSEAPTNTKYAALSYVWGLNQSYVLTMEMANQGILVLETRSLPKTILDAILVTQQLGLEYLWVDALCIAQDSDSDKAFELSRMRLVYQRAFVTLVAANASSSSQGFLSGGQPPEYFVSPMEIPFHIEQSGSEHLLLSYPANYKRWKDPINSRAWTLQEQLLSPHLLVYSYNGVQSICRKDPVETFSTPSFVQGLTWNTPLFTVGGSELASFHQVWLAIRSEYTQRQLTYGKDKLFAISAVAEELARGAAAANSEGEEYLAGLWRSSLVKDLQWRRDTTSDAFEWTRLYPRPAEYRAPTWSWAAVDGYILPHEEEVQTETMRSFQVRSCTVALMESRLPYGAVCRGVAKLEGAMRRFEWLFSKLDTDRCDGWLVEVSKGETRDIVGEVSLDAVEPALETSAMVWCMAISLLKYEHRRTEVEGIILLPEEDGRHHRRIGLFRVYSEGMFNDSETAIVDIV